MGTSSDPNPAAGDADASIAGSAARATAGLASGGLDWARELDALAERFLDAGGPAGYPGTPLDAAIAVRRLAIGQLAPGLGASAGLDLRNNLAVDLASRYQAAGGLADLLESCALSREVLAGAAPGDLLAAAAGLAGRLSLLARNPGYEDELDQAISLLTAILERSAPGAGDRPVVVTSLAGLELHRWQRDGDLDALAAAAGAAAAALGTGEVTGATPGAVNVAALMLEQAEQVRDTVTLEAGEALLRAVVTDGSPGDAVAARGSLAVTLVTRFDLEGGEELLTEAIEWASAAIAARPAGPSRAEDRSARAAARAALARLRGDPGLLSAAIADCRAAAAEPATYSADPSGPLNSLAMLLAERYDLLGDSANLDESVTVHEGLLANPRVSADGRPAIASNLANGLLARFERDRTVPARLPRARADLRRAADLADEAVARTAPGSVHLAGRHDTAGRIRAALGYHLGPGDPAGAAGQGEAAERHARAAVGATPEGAPDRAHYLNNWAMWVTDRWDRTADPAALAEAIALLEAALAAAQGDGQLRATISFNLGVRVQERFELARGRGDADLDDLQRACDLLDDVLAAGFPHLTVPAGKRLGDIAVSLSMWPQAEHALRLALAAAGDLTGQRPLRPDKQRARSGVQGIGALAALCAARAGDAAAAALHLEQASATLLAESLGVRADTVTFADITGVCRAMRRSILFLGGTPAGGLAVLADESGDCRAVELPGLTDSAVRSATAVFRRQLAAALAGPAAEQAADQQAADQPAADQPAADQPAAIAGAALAGPADRLTDRLAAAFWADDPLAACHAAGDQLTRWTWETVLAPLGELLAGTGRLAVLPLGRLAWLPVAAAGPPGGHPPALAQHEPVLLIRATAGPGAAGSAAEQAAAGSAAPPAAAGPAAPPDVAGSAALPAAADRAALPAVTGPAAPSAATRTAAPPAAAGRAAPPATAPPATAPPAVPGPAAPPDATRHAAGKPGGERPRVLVWADTGPSDRAIPHVLDEAREVAALYPGARSRLRDRSARDPAARRAASAGQVPANRARGRAAALRGAARPGAAMTGQSDLAGVVALLRSADIVHLACHCDVDPEYPEDTVLHVDPPVRMGDVGVGVLGARAHVVLSACDAALTADSLPDEALSPAAAFLLAGAGTVTAPVWPVDDETASGFMVDYHRALAAGAEPGQALSQVQAAWSARRPAFDYAPWVVVLRPRGTAAP